jgi:Fe-S-cluster containining protein
MSPKPWYHKGLKFSCTQCGNCCRNHGDYAFVYLTAPEVTAIAAHLGLSRRSFLSLYCTKHEGAVTIRTDSPACPFLGADNRCGVYPVRPKQCATWPFWRENLERSVWEDEVKACCPGIGEGELHDLEEIERTASEDARWYGLE